MRRAAALLLLILGVHDADAGVMYRYRTVSDDPLAKPADVRVFIEGENVRKEVVLDEDTPRTHDLAISRDGGTSWTYVNRQLGTYFRSDEDPILQTGAHPSVTSRLFKLPFSLNGESFDRVKIETSPAQSDTEVAGRETTRHELRFSYRIRGKFSGSRLEAVVVCTLVRWAVEGITLAPHEPMRTGVPVVDARLAEWQASVGHTIAREEISIARTITGGEPVHEMREFVVEEIARHDAAPGAFDVPSGLTHQHPIIGAPGGGPQRGGPIRW